jgi:hypothetical protein
MTTPRLPLETRKFHGRLEGLMKKSNQLCKMFGVEVALFVRDGTELTGFLSNTWLQDVGVQLPPDMVREDQVTTWRNKVTCFSKSA